VRAEKTHLQLLWKKAQKMGFTPDGMRQMLTLLNVNPRTMRLDQLRDLWPYINAINAKKFG
jgi:hypothetical protein